MTEDRSPSKSADVCVIGAGIAGGLVAYQIARNGYDVVILEAGERFEMSERTERMEKAIRPEHVDNDVWNMGGARDSYTTTNGRDYPLNRTRVKGVGGSTLKWLGNTPRFHQKDFEMESRYGVGEDWPIDYNDIQRYYLQAERELGVAGGSSNSTPTREQPYPLDPFGKRNSDRILEDACEELGISVRPCPQARNSEVYDGRSQCVGYSTCEPVCPSGAKYSGDVHILKAENEGARVIDKAQVEKIHHDDQGEHITHVEYVTTSGKRFDQEAEEFVIACGGIETPRILLLSKSKEYPNGIANNSGVVGKYFMEHPMVSTTAVVNRELNSNPIGFVTMTSEHYYDHDDAPPGSILFEFGRSNPKIPIGDLLDGGYASSINDLSSIFSSGKWGDNLLANNEVQDGNILEISALVEMLPKEDNYVRLDESSTDKFGNPVPEISISIGDYARRTIERAVEIQKDILTEAGATIVETGGINDITWASHHMGTTRMGTNPRESVVDSRLQSHDIGRVSEPFRLHLQWPQLR